MKFADGSRMSCVRRTDRNAIASYSTAAQCAGKPLGAQMVMGDRTLPGSLRVFYINKLLKQFGDSKII